MRYRVAFAKRVQSNGDDSGMRPAAELDSNLPDGIGDLRPNTARKSWNEDDAFLGSAAPEVWDYEVVDDRAPEFEDAIKKSDLVLDYDVVDSDVTEADEVTPVGLADRSVYPAD